MVADPYQMDRLAQQQQLNPSAFLRALLAPRMAQVETQGRQNQAQLAFQQQQQQQAQQTLGMQTQLALSKHESDLNRAERERTREFQMKMAEMSMAQKMEMLDKQLNQQMMIAEMQIKAKGGRGGPGKPGQPGTSGDPTAQYEYFYNNNLSALTGGGPATPEQQQAAWQTTHAQVKNIGLKARASGDVNTYNESLKAAEYGYKKYGPQPKPVPSSQSVMAP